MDLHIHKTKDIMKNEEFKQSVLGIHVCKDGITFCLHPAHRDISDIYIQTENGAFSKEEIMKKIEEFDHMITECDPSLNILTTTISFPGPIENDAVVITNWWSTGDNRFKRKEFSVFNCCCCQKFSFINDIQSLGHSIISTDELYGLEDDFIPLWKPPAMDVMPVLYPLYFSSDAAVVLEISIGLGAAFIIPMDSTNSYHVISSEWGHSLLQLCGPEEPNFEEELELMNFIREKKGAAVEWEDICSCRGLRMCYDFEVSKKKKESNQQSGLYRQSMTSSNAPNSIEFDQIMEIEKNVNDSIAQKALETHFKFIMRFARTCAVGFKCQSVFITYSVFNEGHKEIQKHVTMCRDEFMHFTKSEWVSNVSVFVQRSIRNMLALGALYHALIDLDKIENKKSFPISELL